MDTKNATNGRLTETLLDSGICEVQSPFSTTEIARFNSLLDPLLAQRSNERRAYVYVNELHELGLLEQLLSTKMRSILFAIIPDAVLYHCHVYEIAAHDTRPHIFADSLLGWHRDQDSELVKGQLTHLSLFVYLTDVGSDDGAFEFAPTDPTSWLYSGTPCTKVMGPAGYTFAWQRSFYHRASPNRGAVRRRLFKISIQSREFPSAHLANDNFRALLAAFPHGDGEFDSLLGRTSDNSKTFGSGTHVRAAPIAPTGNLNISNVELIKVQLRERTLALRQRIKGKQSESKSAAYD